MEINSWRQGSLSGQERLKSQGRIRVWARRAPLPYSGLSLHSDPIFFFFFSPLICFSFLIFSLLQLSKNYPEVKHKELKEPRQARPRIAGSFPQRPKSAFWGLHSGPNSKSWYRIRWFQRPVATQSRGTFCSGAPLLGPGYVISGVCWPCQTASFHRHQDLRAMSPVGGQA